MAEDHDGVRVFMARNAWDLDRMIKDWPALTLQRHARADRRRDGVRTAHGEKRAANPSLRAGTPLYLILSLSKDAGWFCNVAHSTRVLRQAQDEG